jgi:hypothetical protein
MEGGREGRRKREKKKIQAGNTPVDHPFTSRGGSQNNTLSRESICVYPGEVKREEDSEEREEEREEERDSLISMGTLMHSTGIFRMLVEGVGEEKREEGGGEGSGGSWLIEFIESLKCKLKTNIKIINLS